TRPQAVVDYDTSAARGEVYRIRSSQPFAGTGDDCHSFVEADHCMLAQLRLQFGGMPSNAKLIAASTLTRALRIIRDRSPLLIRRAACEGAHRCEEFRNLSGAARSTLTSRLNGLVENGLLERVRYSDAPPRFEYRLTAMGLALYGVTLVTWRW